LGVYFLMGLDDVVDAFFYRVFWGYDSGMFVNGLGIFSTAL
jgi:hypothetical protein